MKKKSVHNGWTSRRRKQREDDAWAREEGFKNFADLNRDDERLKLCAALKSGEHDDGCLFAASAVAVVFGIPVKRVRLAVRTGKLRAIRSKKGRKLWFQSSELEKAKPALLTRSAAILRSRNYSSASELITKAEAAKRLGISTRAIDYRVKNGKNGSLKPIRFGNRTIRFRADSVAAIAKRGPIRLRLNLSPVERAALIEDLFRLAKRKKS